MKSTSKDLHQLPGLGLKTTQMLEEVSIFNEEDLRSLGAPQAYVRLKLRFSNGVNRNALHALYGAIEGKDWRELTLQEKDALDLAVEEALNDF